MVEANFPGTGVIHKPNTSCIVVFPGINGTFFSLITKQSFLLTFESTIDCSAFTMKFCLFFLLSFSFENSCWEAF